MYSQYRIIILLVATFWGNNNLDMKTQLIVSGKYYINK